MSLRTLLLTAFCTLATAEWTLIGGKATIHRRGDAEPSPLSFEANKPLPSPLALGPKETLKLSLSVQDGSNPGRPHQAFVLVKDTTSKLETFYPLSVKESSGKAKVDLSHKEIPAHLLDTPELELSIVLASFGSSPGSLIKIGSVVPILDDAVKVIIEQQKVKDLGEGAVVYKAKHEIRHIFRPDPKSPPVIITLAFLIAVLGGFVGLLGLWFPLVGANLSDLPKALQAAPLAHIGFFGSLLAMEGLFFMYYTSWNLFQTLTAAAIVGPVFFFSGSRALTEVQARRVRNER